MNAASERPCAGMSFIQMLPFPAFNPLNWGALTPARAAIAAIEAFRLNLLALRGACDAWRNLAREQQDLYLDMLEAQLNGRERLESERETDAEAQDMATFTLLALFDSYTALSRDFLGGQNDALSEMRLRH